MFPEQLGVLDHGALERLKDHAALFQLIGNYIPFDEFVAGEDHTAGHFIQAARSLQNRGALFFT